MTWLWWTGALTLFWPVYVDPVSDKPLSLSCPLLIACPLGFVAFCIQFFKGLLHSETPFAHRVWYLKNIVHWYYFYLSRFILCQLILFPPVVNLLIHFWNFNRVWHNSTFFNYIFFDDFLQNTFNHTGTFQINVF